MDKQDFGFISALKFYAFGVAGAAFIAFVQLIPYYRPEQLRGFVCLILSIPLAVGAGVSFEHITRYQRRPPKRMMNVVLYGVFAPTVGLLAGGLIQIMATTDTILGGVFGVSITIATAVVARVVFYVTKSEDS
jgi:hypothetical protein